VNKEKQMNEQDEMMAADASAEQDDQEIVPCPGNDEGDHVFTRIYDIWSPCKYCGMKKE
jgi:hypothetical protein